MFECQMKLHDCEVEAKYVFANGAGGDTFACGPCMNAAEDVAPDEWIPLYDGLMYQV